MKNWYNSFSSFQFMADSNEEKTRIYEAGLFVWALFFALIYMSLSVWTTPNDGDRIFNSPDETSNYFFTQLFTEKNSLHIQEPLNIKYENAIHPRAVSVAEDGSLGPGSFLGIIIIYGMISKFFGSWSIIFLTPIISIIGVIFYFKVIREFFSDSIAFLSSILLLIFPAFWYYNSRSMFHNVLFLNLFIFFIYSLIQAIHKKSSGYILLSSAFLGLAIVTRTSEALWLICLFIAVLAINAKKIGVKKIFFGIFFIILISGIINILQYKIFGNFFTGAYSIPLKQGGIIRGIYFFIFPFGLHLRSSFIHFYEYSAILFWWFFIPCVLGFVINIAKKKNNESMNIFYVATFSIISLFLIIYYGSWRVVDNLDPGKITIGTSYVRYWLPIYAFSLPFVGIFILKTIQIIRQKFIKTALMLTYVFIFIYFSYSIVWTNTEESLASVHTQIQNYYLKRDRVSERIQDSSFIVTEKSDKIFFPKYKIIMNILDENSLNAIYNIQEDDYPIYYYSHWDAGDIEKVNNALGMKGLELWDKTKIYENEYLYSVIKKSQAL